MPNPHIVSIVESEDIRSDVQKQLSEYVNGPNPLFPDGVNVSFVKTLQEGAIYVRTFERGVGFTNACGTAMSASSLVTCINGLNEKEKAIEVYNNGGKVRCVVHETEAGYWIELIGNATYVYQASIELEMGASTFHLLEKQNFESETKQYKKLEELASQFVNEHM